MRLALLNKSAMPPLAWVATIENGSGKVAVIHGDQVEVGPDWFAEAVWDGPFERDGLLNAKNLFGSAGAATGDNLTLLTSTALVDRIVTAESPDRIVASNSLPLLLAATGAELDQAHDYDAEWQAILAGVDEYDAQIRTLTPAWQLRQHFYGTVVIDPATFTVTRQRYGHTFAPETFADIETELRRVTQAVASNARDQQRIAPMAMTTTLSSGYDSTGTAALAAAVGADTAFTRTKTTSLVPDFIRSHEDDGRPAAAVLGLRVVEVGDRPAKDWEPEVELGLLAGSATFRELVLLPVAVELAAEPHTAILFTGYHGDKNWDSAPPAEHLGTDIRRGDVSGLTLAESRLHAGFLNVPLPFVGAESIDAFVKVSRSAEMKPWSVGGDYDRPIPRRFAEEAGVPREVFGKNKRAVWSFVGRLEPLHSGLRRRFANDLRPNRIAWSPGLNRTELRARAVADILLRKVAKRSLKRTVPARYSRQSTASFHWAVGELTAKYRAALG